VRKIQTVADWLDLHDAKREDQKLKARYEADVKQRPADERGYVWSEYSAEYALIWEPTYVRRTNKVVARAHKYGVRVPPKPTDSSGNDNWEWSLVGSDWILTNSAQERLNQEIKDEARQNEDEFRKRVTLVVSLAAFILALVSLIMKGKQPDPCPKNYYRNEQGECVFALLKKSTPQQSTTVAPSVLPTKPSPTKPKP